MSTLDARQEKVIRKIGGERLLELTRDHLALWQATPQFRFPPSGEMDKQRASLRKALAKVTPELRAAMSGLHAVYAAHLGFGATAAGFDPVRYLEYLASVRIVKKRGNQLRQDVVIAVDFWFMLLGIEETASLKGPLVRYLNVLDELLDFSEDIRQLAREVIARH